MSSLLSEHENVRIASKTILKVVVCFIYTTAESDYEQLFFYTST